MMVKYVDCEKAKEMFNRYFHNLQGSEAQILVCDMKQAFFRTSNRRCAGSKAREMGKRKSSDVWANLCTVFGL